MPAQNYIAGFEQSITVGSTPVCVTNGKFTETNEVIDVTGSCSGGKKQSIAGLSIVTGSFDMNFDTNNPVDLPAGTYFSIHYLLNATEATQGLQAAAAQVVSRDFSAPVPGAVTQTVNFQTSGPYTITLV